MATPLPDQPYTTEHVKTALDAVYNWNYDSEVDQVRSLYANALDRQWIAMRDLDWEREIDKEAFSRTFSLGGTPTSGRNSRSRSAGVSRAGAPRSCSRTSCTVSRGRCSSPPSS